MPTAPSAIDILTRGVEGLYSPEELERKLAAERPLRIKLGMDPTAPDIHLGHVVVLRKMRQFQDLGHKAILLIGDYTARIGDPTGRDTARPVLGEDEIEANAQTYLEQASAVLDTAEDKLELRRNSEWLNRLSFADVLRLTGQITVQQMLHRDMFRRRMEQDREIVLSEFMYPLMQAYDSVALEADVELGGTDQTFNNLMGRQLMDKMGLEKQVVLVMPILIGLDGQEKMSKSKGNYVGVRFEPADMFGKIMSIPDSLMANYFTLLTDVPPERVATLCNLEQTHPRAAKAELARDITAQFHGLQAAEQAAEAFDRQFAQGQLPQDLETKTLSSSPLGLTAVLREVGFASSNSEARRLVQQGAVSLDGEKLSDPEQGVDATNQPVLKVGKRRVCRLSIG